MQTDSSELVVGEDGRANHGFSHSFEVFMWELLIDSGPETAAEAEAGQGRRTRLS